MQLVEELIEKWKSLLYHVTGVHSWIEEGKLKKCEHDDLSPEERWENKKWLEKDSRAFLTTDSCLGQRTFKLFAANG